MKTLSVTLPSGAYPIHIGAGILNQALPDLVQHSRCERVVVITNTTLAQLYPSLMDQALAPLKLPINTLTVPDGEQYKTLQTLSTLYDGLMALEANRKLLIIAFGGGVVGDMAGFCAATFMRGVPLLQVPTTLLAQVDSSVGGKTAVNHPRGKNTIGAFKQPAGVVMDLSFLGTLPERERIAGLFELVKHGFIRDRELFDFLEDRQNLFRGNNWGFWEEAVYRSCQVKADVVQQDETEQGLRAVLNFGHTLGHLIETHTGYDSVLHGEAVGVGMLFAAYVSRELGALKPEAFQRVAALLEPLIRPVTLPPLDRKGFVALLMHDKKAAHRTLSFILLRGLGESFIRTGTTPEELWPLFQGFLEEAPGALRLSTV